MSIYKVAVDIGGTNIKSAVINANDLSFIENNSVATPNNDTELIIDEVYRIVKYYKDKYDISDLDLGISSAGVIDSVAGSVVYSGPTIPNYKGTNFKDYLAPLYSNIAVLNDVNAALLGELTYHNYQQDNIFCLTIGTGIGGAFYNRTLGIHTGARHRANQIGYLLYDSHSETTFETRASTSGLKQLMEAKNYPYDSNVKQLFKDAKQGDTLANDILNEWSAYLAEGIAQIQIIYDPDVILIGGAISAQGDNLLNYIVPKLECYLPHNYGHAQIQTALSLNNAALIGAIANLL